MEQFKALRAGGKPGSLQHTTLEADQLLRLQREPGKPCVFLLTTDDLARLASTALPGLITDRGTKDKRRQLSHYFRKHTGVIRLQAVYAHAGLVERGVRDLLRSENLLPGVVCLIGLREDLFRDLGKRALPASPGSSTVEAVPGYDDVALRKLLNDHAVFNLPRQEQEKYDGIAREYIGSSPRIEWVRRLIWLAAQSKHPVLIQGESGTGKEIVARQIGACSSLAAGPFRTLNCGAIPTELFESELFGHVKGAFSGATMDKDGYMTLAMNGILFLDEIGDLRPEHQVKILRVLEGGKFTKVGEKLERTSNARIIAATNRDLASLVRAGKFREDLYYRLFSIRIRTPSLREHPEDIPALAQHFWQKVNRDDGHDVAALPAEITAELAEYPWPGNARELRGTLVNIAMVAGGRAATLPLVRAVMHDRRGLIPIPELPEFNGTTDTDG